MSAYAASINLRSATASNSVRGLSFTCRINLPLPCSKHPGSGNAAPWKNPTLTWDVNAFTYPNGTSPRQAFAHPSWNTSRTSSPHPRITSNHSRAIAPSSPACVVNHASIRASRSRTTSNRSSGSLKLAPRSHARHAADGSISPRPWSSQPSQIPRSAYLRPSNSP